MIVTGLPVLATQDTVLGFVLSSIFEAFLRYKAGQCIVGTVLVILFGDTDNFEVTPSNPACNFPKVSMGYTGHCKAEGTVAGFRHIISVCLASRNKAGCAKKKRSLFIS